MTTIYKQVNDTTVSLLTAVGTVANSVAKTVNSTASSLDMLDAFVQKAKREQAERYVSEAVQYRTTLMEEASIDAAKRQEKLVKELSSNPQLSKLYQENISKLEAAFAAFDAPKE